MMDIEKVTMKNIFQVRKKLKNGLEGKSFIFPKTFSLHTDPNFVNQWVEYSCLDAETTYFLY
jgi:hypothetical protein